MFCNVLIFTNALLRRTNKEIYHCLILLAEMLRKTVGVLSG